MNPSGLMADSLMGPGGRTTGSGTASGTRASAAARSAGRSRSRSRSARSTSIPNAPAWGINFQRTVRRKNEESLWTGHQRNQGLRRMSNAGLLVGITDVSQGVGARRRPYVAGDVVADAPGRVPEVAATATATSASTSSTTSRRACARICTVNTDFAETEVDKRQVNLTRFPLFFPEKRAFFLDGATFFDFSPIRPCVRSSAAGSASTQNGQPQTIDVGGKLTGQAGRERRRRAATCAPARAPGARRGLPRRCACGGACCASRTSVASTRAGDRGSTDLVRPDTPPASTSGSRPRRSAAPRTSRSAGFWSWSIDAATRRRARRSAAAQLSRTTCGRRASASTRCRRTSIRRSGSPAAASAAITSSLATPASAAIR